MRELNRRDRVALVTGASSGFGAVTARRLAGQGFRVFGTSRSARAPADGHELLVLDVDSDQSVQECVGSLLARTGRIDVLINNAGRAMVGACEETSADEARALFETNFFGVMRMASAVLPAMRAQRHGLIVNLGSVSGFVGTPFHGVYAASKHALAGYTEALRFEVREHGIGVALIEPAAHRTQIQMLRPGRPLSLYDAGRDRVEQLIRGQIDGGDSPERVVDAILRAVNGHARVARQRVGAIARLAAFGRRWLPAGAFEWLMRREFRLTRG